MALVGSTLTMKVRSLTPCPQLHYLTKIYTSQLKRLSIRKDPVWNDYPFRITTFQKNVKRLCQTLIPVFIFSASVCISQNKTTLVWRYPHLSHWNKSSNSFEKIYSFYLKPCSWESERLTFTLTIIWTLGLMSCLCQVCHFGGWNKGILQSFLVTFVASYIVFLIQNTCVGFILH